MRTLDLVLEQRGLVSAQQVAEAGARAALHGGDLTTSLLQLTSIDEDALTAALGDCYGLPVVSPGALARAHVEAPLLVLQEIAERHCCFPLERSADRLIVAVARPLLPEVKQELSERLGLAIEEHVAIEVRIRQAIARDYGLPLAPRHQRGIARLDGAPEQAPDETPSAIWSVPRLSALPRPPSGPPIATLPTNGHAATSISRHPTSPPVNRPSRRRGHYTHKLVEIDLQKAKTREEALGAYFMFVNQYFEYSALFAVHSSLAEGLDACGPGADREQVQGIGIPLDLPSSLARASNSGQPSLVVLGDSGLDATLVQDLGRHRDRQVLLLPICIKTRCALLLYADNGESDVRVAELSEVIAVTPLMIKALERVIRLRKQQKAEKARRASLDPAALAPPSEAPAAPATDEPRHGEFEAAWPPPILSAPIAAASRPPSRPAPKSSPAAGSRLQASGFRPQAPDPGASPHASTTASSPTPASAAAPTPRVSEPAVVSRRVVAIEPAEPRRPTPLPPDDPLFLLARRADSWRPGRDSSQTSSAAAEAVTAAAPEPSSRQAPGSRLRVANSNATSDFEPEPALAPFPLAPVSSPAPAVDSAAATDPAPPASLSDPPPVRSDPPPFPSDLPPSFSEPPPASLPTTLPPTSSPKVPAAARVPRHPASRQLAPLRPIEKPATEITLPAPVYALKRLPSVIIGTPPEPEPAPAAKRKPTPPALPATHATGPSQPPSSPEPDLAALVEQLCRGQSEAALGIARAGNAALPHLMKRFPGPILSEHAGRASESGPLLGALAKIGTPSLGYVVRASESEDESVRRWATLLLGEMPSADASKAVVQRLADDLPQVHQAALDAARLLLAGPAANQFRRALFETADEKRAPLKLRLRSIEHAAKLKDSASVPRLISLLNSGVEPITHKALWALTMVTRNDMGRDIQAWSDWWHAHRSQHRTQWLIAALDHDDLRVRRAAAEELTSEVNEDFGYRAELERPERIQAQMRYRDWWSSVGARRYGRLY